MAQAEQLEVPLAAMVVLLVGPEQLLVLPERLAAAKALLLAEALAVGAAAPQAPAKAQQLLVELAAAEPQVVSAELQEQLVEIEAVMSARLPPSAYPTEKKLASESD